MLRRLGLLMLVIASVFGAPVTFVTGIMLVATGGNILPLSPFGWMMIGTSISFATVGIVMLSFAALAGSAP